MDTLMLLLLIVLSPLLANAAFYPDINDYDAYGMKIAANDILFVQAKNHDHNFLVQFAPYNNTNDSLHCSLPYADSSHYVYTVGVGYQPSTGTPPYFYYAGEVVPHYSKRNAPSGATGIFIAIYVNRDNTSVQSYIESGLPFSCDNAQIEQTEYITGYKHQEYFVIAVEPYGEYAIGLATDVVFRYQPFHSGTLTNQSAATVWPNNATFQPRAADASVFFTIVAGFVKSSDQSRIRATPTVYLLRNDDLTVRASWTYTPAENSWQSYLTYSGIDTWTKKYTMSVKIDGDNPTRVLVGMPFLNTVFLFVIGNGGMDLAMASSMSYERSVGFGKSVTWLSSTQAAILYSAYSPDYSTWYWSHVYVYTWLPDTKLPPSPTAVIPNAQQPLPPTISARFIRLISTPTAVGILDQAGGTMLILSESAGFYPSTDITNSPVGAAMPVVSHAASCIGGTFKADFGIHPCALCPAGSRNAGDTVAATCRNCSADAFCPLGAIYEVDKSYLTSLSQATSYPRSPETTAYEDLLVSNMITFGLTAQCLRVSPLFWTLVLLVIVVVLLLFMTLLGYCVQEPKRTAWRTRIKRVFLRTDLVVSTSRCLCTHRCRSVF